MITNGSDPIDADSVNDIYAKVDRLTNKLINLVWKNNQGNSTKIVRALDGKKLQVLAATIEVGDKTSRDTEVSIDVAFHPPFGGNKGPTVVAMPESPSPYGLSVKRVNNTGFTLVIHQFADNSKQDNFNLNAVHYIAVGMA